MTVPFGPQLKKNTYRSNCSAHPDSAKVIRVQVLVTVEVEARGSKSHAGPGSELESPSGHVPKLQKASRERGTVEFHKQTRIQI